MRSLFDPRSNDDIRAHFTYPSGEHLLVRTEGSARAFIERNPGRALIYVLHNPEGTPLYAGWASAKTRMRRPFSHARDVLKGVKATPEKIEALRPFVETGTLRYSIDSFLPDGEHYDREPLLIHVLGLKADNGPLYNGQDWYSYLGPGGPAGGFVPPTYILE